VALWRKKTDKKGEVEKPGIGHTMVIEKHLSQLK
jgi:hypothetical protein